MNEQNTTEQKQTLNLETLAGYRNQLAHELALAEQGLIEAQQKVYAVKGAINFCNNLINSMAPVSAEAKKE